MPSTSPETLPPLESNLLTVPEVAARAVVSEYTVWRWIRAGELAHVKFGRLTRVREEDWLAYLKRRTQVPTKAPRGPGRPRKDQGR
jgi:excisionase family DNA binding protein